MSALLPVAVYGLKVPAGDVMIPALAEFPATFRITMAAIDPSAAPEDAGTATASSKPRAVLKMVYNPDGPEYDDDSEDSEDDEEGEFLKKLLASKEAEEDGDDDDDEEEDDDEEDDEEDSDDEEEKNGGPSDPSKTKRARKQAALEQILATMNGNDEDDEDEMDMDGSPKINGTAKIVDKGKGKATDEDSDSDDEELGEGLEALGMEEMVICTLDPEKNYQQTLDITIPEDQTAYFKVSGTHTVYLTGNFVIPAEHSHRNDSYLDDDDDDSEEDYDLEPDDIDIELDEDASDELDDLEDPRIMEVESEEEIEAPKLVKKAEPSKKEESVKKGANKRPAEDSEDEPANLDDIMAKSLKPEAAPVEEPKLSKKQLKKLKKNNGKAAEAPATETNDAKANDKKVQFAKNLEAPPSGSQAKTNGDSQVKTNGDSAAAKAKPGVKTVQGVSIDDKKVGKGPAAKNGSTVDMRYIGKLKDNKVFDSNKSGKPFSFKIGKGEVIKGWDIGVAGMSAGGERRIIVPANLGYGKKAMPGIPSNSNLTFDLKLLAVK